jgi:hypothetical protein
MIYKQQWFLFQFVYNIENMVWLYWSFSTPPTPGTDPGPWMSKGSLIGSIILSRPLKSQGADLNSLQSAVLRRRWPQTIPCSCLPVAWITELSHQFRRFINNNILLVCVGKISVNMQKYYNLAAPPNFFFFKFNSCDGTHCFSKNRKLTVRSCFHIFISLN